MEGASENCSSSELVFIEEFGLFDDFPEEAKHPLLIDDYEDEAETRRKLKVQAENIYKPVDGMTQLHRALRQMRETRINTLIDFYQEDFEKVGRYLEKEYQWDSADRFWLRKNILVASSEEECRNAKSLENKQISRENLREAVFVLLQHPVENEEVAILYPVESTRLSVIQLMNRLISNGFLSWSCQETHGRRETFMEMAASCGLNHVIGCLHDLGAPIAIPYHNPLLSAFRFNQKDTIQLLLTKYFDNFDCTIRDEQNSNAVIAAMCMNDRKMFELCLDKLIAYRQRYYNETESQAFNGLFRFENEMSTTSSIFTYCQNRVRGSVERAIVKYGIDLSYQWKEVTILICMLSKNIATEYCYEGIRKNPKLLGMMVQDDTRVLHEVLRLQHTEFLCEMYQRNPEVKEYFNGEGGFNALRTALCYRNHKIVQFILEHHNDFVRNDAQKLKDIVCSCGFSKEYYEKHYRSFMRYFPEFKEEIKRTRVQATSQMYCYGIEQSFANVGVNVSKIDDIPKPYARIRGSKGETLLHLATEKDNKELFLQLIEAGCDLDTMDNEGNHSIHFVQSESMLDLIVDRHTEGRNLVHRMNQDGLTVLHKICSLRMEDEPLISLLERVVDLGADVHQLTKKGESAVHFLGSTAALEMFRKYNVQLDTATDDGETALLRHLHHGNVWMARALLKYVHQLPTFIDHAHKYLEPMLRRNRDWFTGDYQDFLEEHREITKLLFDSLFKHSREEASRVFNKVCVYSFNYVSRKFLEFDYDLDYNYQDECGNTPIVGLLSYMEESDMDIVEKLLHKGVDLHIRNKRSQDALLAYVERFQTAKWWWGHDAGTVQLLVDHGAAVNTADEDGNTPLHLAFKDGEVELIEVLVRNGANVRIKNKAGNFPLQMASAVNQELFYFLR